MSEKKLKACPFCGGEAEFADVYDAALDLDGIGGQWWVAGCAQCQISTFKNVDKNTTAQKWNARASAWIVIKSDADLPKENGQYLVTFAEVGKPHPPALDLAEFTTDKRWELELMFLGKKVREGLSDEDFQVIAYQKIEPYQETTTG